NAPAPALTVTTGSLPAGTVGTAYAQSLAASGGTGGYTWSVASGSLPPGLTLNSGSGVISGTPTLAGTFQFTIQVSDTQNSQASGLFSLTVQSPVSITTATTLANGVAGIAYSQTLAASGGVPPYTWSLVSGPLPTGLSLNSGTGAIGGTPTQTGTFPLTVQVKDSANGQAQANFTLLIAGGLTIVTPPVLPVAAISVAYAVTLQAAGGAAPYTWSATSGALPAGLSFNPNGQISGTPTASGSFSFTALAIDANSNRATKDFTLTVASGLTITTAPTLPDGASGAAYGVTLAGTGGTPPYAWSVTAGSLPPGLTLEGPTGALTGTPSASGSFNFTVTLTDSASVTA